MKDKALLVGASLSLAFIVLGCSSNDVAEPTGATSQALSQEEGTELRVDAMFLRLDDKQTGFVGLAVNKVERPIHEQGEVTLQLSERDKPVTFNDRGKDGDTKARDGVFTAALPIDIERLQAVARESQRLEQRVISEFDPGSREVIGEIELSKEPIDFEALFAGKLVRLPKLTQFGPLQTLDAVTTNSINWQKSLLIKSLPVLEDPARTANPCSLASNNDPLKAWTFGHLMTQMAQGSGLSAGDFTESWLEHWLTPQTVMDQSASVLLDTINNNAQGSMNSFIINPWRARSGGGTLDMRMAPFRLEAILYRPDLAISSPYGGGPNNTAGELRFVFSMMEVRDQNNDGDALDAGDTCRPLEAAVILEYGVPLTQCQDIKAWANDWAALSDELPGTPAFNGALEALTEAVVLQGSDPSKPNGNALNQLRTNEIELTGVWQFREFHLKSSGVLEQATTANNPREHQFAFTSTGSTPTPLNLNGTDLLRDEITSNLFDILNNRYTAPELSAGQPFLGGASSYNFGTSWDHPDLTTPDELDARFNFSLNTCSGCHTDETDTSFYHIPPSGPGSSPTLSSFLMDNPHHVVDVRGVARTFNEMDNRKQALSTLANRMCTLVGGLPPFELAHVRLQAVH